MKCQKCGTELVPGHLYCEVCGAEFQIVPDFEPELENSIAESLSDISETVEKDFMVNINKLKTKAKTMKVPSFTIILALVFVCSLFFFIGYTKYTNSTSYQNKKAMEAISKQDYYQASAIYEKLRKHNGSDAYWYIKEAEIKLLMQEEEQAYQLAQSAISLDDNTDYAYYFLLDYLESKGHYIEMKQLLDTCPFPEIIQEYSEYACQLPAINYESGIYESIIEISFKKGYEGTIYYTLNNGSTTSDIPIKYEKPIKLGNGSHTLNLVYENKYGIQGSTHSFTYEINSPIPMAPQVSLTSGIYGDAQMISVEIEEGCSVYYTTDLSSPTQESTLYTSPIALPLGESRFNFIAYSENGIASEITRRNYMLNMKTNLSIDDAEVKLVQKLISTGHILDKNGAVSGRYGVFRYFYKYPIYEADINYYVFEEHYMENQINNPLQHFYAVDVLYGTVYKLIPDGNGNFTRIEF